MLRTEQLVVRKAEEAETQRLRREVKDHVPAFAGRRLIITHDKGTYRV
jgi:hypothetical protein